jgi:hypothetical protein
VVSVLATGPKDCGFVPGQGDGFIRTIKTRSTPSFRMGSKDACLMSDFTACKRNLEVSWGWID